MTHSTEIDVAKSRFSRQMFVLSYRTCLCYSAFDNFTCSVESESKLWNSLISPTCHDFSELYYRHVINSFWSEWPNASVDDLRTVCHQPNAWFPSSATHSMQERIQCLCLCVASVVWVPYDRRVLPCDHRVCCILASVRLLIRLRKNRHALRELRRVETTPKFRRDA